MFFFPSSSSSSNQTHKRYRSQNAHTHTQNFRTIGNKSNVIFAKRNNSDSKYLLLLVFSLSFSLTNGNFRHWAAKCEGPRQNEGASPYYLTVQKKTAEKF